ncbi:MAG: CHAT domain-containing protein [Anaerolineales bacterium]
MEPAELEIYLYPGSTGTHTVELRYNDPRDEAARAPVRGPAVFDLEALHSLRLNPEGYGKLLGASLFGDETVRTFYRECRAAAESHNLSLRLRLSIDPAAAGLYELLWETLRDPVNDDWLATSENLVFSRFLGSSGWERVQLRSKGDLRALILVANPQDLAEGKYVVQEQALAPVDVDGELARARAGLAGLAVESLTTEPAEPGSASLKNLVSRLRSGFDVLYLVAHGAMLSRPPAGPYLWLEREDGAADVVPGELLVSALRDLPAAVRPRLVVLASCQSAGRGGEQRAADTGGALVALGPQLARAGIPAVIAMQGEVTMQTIAEFMPVFFEELLEDGQIDRATAAARAAVRQRPDAWMPVLYMRLRSGRLWFVPGFSGERAEFEKWPAILRSIQKELCTPILGPGLYESLLGSQREIAIRWAEQYHFPMDPHERDSMPQVAQFLQVNQYEQAPLDELEEYGVRALRELYQDTLPANLLQGRATLDELIDAAGVVRRQQHPDDPHRVLAELPLPVYITTNYNNLLETALREAGKQPEIFLCPWNDSVERIETIFEREPNYYPSVDRPLIYHLFGRLSEPDSVVLTEDHYFDFLIGVTRNQDLIPEAVKRALTDTALLFLGFQLDDWQFRVLLRSILAQQGGMRRARYPHIAAQLEPEEARLLEPGRARKYLETYFSQGAQISLYWGAVDDFARDLSTRWNPVAA